VRTLKSVPERLTGSGVPPLLEVRGEVFIATADFTRSTSGWPTTASRRSRTPATPPPGACGRRTRASPPAGR
jgi:DNA ligase (NAD+)